ncbi:hypothetical protein FA95DRAFT_1565712 [Auriscalpium vulgare]|uniref:Uncharacterized protein n=1 Tax=Auriscalpium vulgare TaxID=40419 RepID=A0ACB8RC09_9AGAM|nr:hypothetical protein FA95DRAFT_1565712 [Auriscalpium vulgare]
MPRLSTFPSARMLDIRSHTGLLEPRSRLVTPPTRVLCFLSSPQSRAFESPELLNCTLRQTPLPISLADPSDPPHPSDLQVYRPFRHFLPTPTNHSRLTMRLRSSPTSTPIPRRL